MRLDGKVTIITGGGSGMGRTAAELFAREGARVVVADFSEASGEAAAAAVRAAGGQATFVRADVSNEDDARGMVQHAIATYGRVDALYNNAGVMPEA
ncbi:MAG: SDR family NAD(P)-dependent oxidoreductase, partial [Chloroflexi bacterium]|nr:SDR family NAD(P)-dependent oxidoreductase [Chloroflexota bacterium]